MNYNVTGSHSHTWEKQTEAREGDMSQPEPLTHVEIYRLCVLARSGACETRSGKRIIASLRGRAKRIAQRLAAKNTKGKNEEAKCARILLEWAESNDVCVREA